jgi:hypothetical protein
MVRRRKDGKRIGENSEIQWEEMENQTIFGSTMLLIPCFIQKS